MLDNTDRNDSITLKIDQLVKQEVANGTICKYYGYINAVGVISLLDVAELTANPRKPKNNKVTDAIQETLSRSPDLLCCKSKGLLVSSSKVEELQRQRLRLSFTIRESEDVLDGGHNLFAISCFIIETLLSDVDDKLLRAAREIKNWKELKTFWKANKKLLIQLLDETENEVFPFATPIEILTVQYNDEASQSGFLKVVCDICQARNLNEELAPLAVGNQRGYFEVIKNALPSDLEQLVAWTTGDADKKVKGEYVLVLVALIFDQLSKNGEPNYFLESFKSSPVSMYTSRGTIAKQVQYVLEDLDEEEKRSAHADDANSIIKSLELLKALPLIWDTIEMNFPKLYNAFGGRDGRGGSYGLLKPFAKKKTAGKEATLKKDIPCRFHSKGCIQKKGGYETQDGYVAPLMCSVTAFMQYDEEAKCLKWMWDVDEILDFYSNTSKDALISNAMASLGSFITSAVQGDPMLLGRASYVYGPILNEVKAAIAKK